MFQRGNWRKKHIALSSQLSNKESRFGIDFSIGQRSHWDFTPNFYWWEIMLQKDQRQLRMASTQWSLFGKKGDFYYLTCLSIILSYLCNRMTNSFHIQRIKPESLVKSSFRVPEINSWNGRIKISTSRAQKPQVLGWVPSIFFFQTDSKYWAVPAVCHRIKGDWLRILLAEANLCKHHHLKTIWLEVVGYGSGVLCKIGRDGQWAS